MGRLKMRLISKEEVQEVWNTKDLETKRNLMINLLGTLRYKNNYGVLLRDVMEATRPEKLDFMAANLVHCGEGNKTIKL